tara:strand:- start:2519 stop:2692 length:174 start_codon:yes stop_codon:yes gene_type:complete
MREREREKERERQRDKIIYSLLDIFCKKLRKVENKKVNKKSLSLSSYSFQLTFIDER